MVATVLMWLIAAVLFVAIGIFLVVLLPIAALMEWLGLNR